MNKKCYELVGEQFASLLDSLKPGESLSIWRVSMNDEVDDPGSWGCQLLETDERLDDEVPAYRDGIECYSANLPSWQEALAKAGLITMTEEQEERTDKDNKLRWLEEQALKELIVRLPRLALRLVRLFESGDFLVFSGKAPKDESHYELGNWGWIRAGIPISAALKEGVTCTAAYGEKLDAFIIDGLSFWFEGVDWGEPRDGITII